MPLPINNKKRFDIKSSLKNKNEIEKNELNQLKENAKTSNDLVQFYKNKAESLVKMLKE